MQDQQFVMANGCSCLRLTRKRAYHTHVRGDAGYRRDQAMVAVPASSVKGKQALRLPPHQHGIAYLKVIKTWSQTTVRNQFEEELDLVFKRAGYNRIRPLEHAVTLPEPERRVLTWLEWQLLLRTHSD